MAAKNAPTAPRPPRPPRAPRAPRAPKTNRIGLTPDAYRGEPSTLCPGCGHDSISNVIVRVCHELGLAPHRLAKFSGIGCSSKTPGYFLGRAHGFNGAHGRMPPIATGAHLANRTLKGIGVTGDGDTASIGLGHFCHLLRRNVELVYIIENNGVYGLTKGQFSATADSGSTRKDGEINTLPPMDCCGLALELGGGFVARSFSADFKQLAALLKAALAYPGTALLDVISPCVTFNNHAGSTKSYRWSKQHEHALHELDFIPHFEPQAEVKIAPGELRAIELHDGSTLRLKKLEAAYDPSDRFAAMRTLEEARRKQWLVTGLLYYDDARPPYARQLGLVDEPLASLGEERLRPSPESWARMMAALG